MNPVNVVFVFNKQYIGRFKVTLRSLTDSNPDMTFNVHMLHTGLEEADIQDVTRFVKECSANPLFYEVDNAMFEGLPKMPGDSSYSTYKKLLIPEFLNISDKVLYLDCDIIVRGSVAPLFENQSETFLSCTKDIRINNKRKEHIKNIIGDNDHVYFNAGVMLFDLSKKDMAVPKEEAFEYMANNSRLLKYHDQDMFNHFYAKSYTLLDGKYDYMTTFSSVSDMLFHKGKKDAVIVHYANWKPWNENYIGSYYKLYCKYYKMCEGESGVDFLKKRKLSAQLKLIFSYLFRRKK